ncbi:hypothetical protein COV93_02055 [Candidatus Woesearchaeota archaeon CG11_big_fil_rev_8_21_14_0_20_43_8]|nr:MAG: hypothetical protein COV93_02055 [Candidatus Woesearchaeota archaeon CG11_big_fil_rev_8_21_14_0_20_43_8]PIO05158.1 MAG: hypothetical protein COT47_05945 [Candidatus Woesearchaeota archaeon CG08_land_8_20_14_0_20_43_7]
MNNTHRSCILLTVFLVAIMFFGCDDGDKKKDQDASNDTAFTFVGNGAKEGKFYFFKNRDINSVEIYFYEPFYFSPKVQNVNPGVDYNITDVSSWGFKIILSGGGFWKDMQFNVTGILADGREFCYEDDHGQDPERGSKVYTLAGIFQDICLKDNVTHIEEQYCQNNTLVSKVMLCDKTCYSDGGPAVCANGTNVEQDCIDPTSGVNYYEKNHVMYNGVRYDDYCIGQIHGTNKELTEYTCSKKDLDQENQFCALGCVNGKCLQNSDFIVPQITFGALTDANKTGEYVTFRLFATDDIGLYDLILYEQNSTRKWILTYHECENKKTCNMTLKMTNHDTGLYIYEAIARNFYNNTAYRNITLNFSSDVSGPVIKMTVNPVRLNISNFTYISINVTDNKGIKYLTLVKQPINSPGILLSAEDCKEKTTCFRRFKLGMNASGFYNLIVNAVDTDQNSASLTRAIEVHNVNETFDIWSPNVTFSIDKNDTYAGYYITVNYKVVDDQQLGAIGFYKKTRNNRWEYVSGLNCGNKTSCTGEFIYKNKDTGKVIYMVNATDSYGNYEFKQKTVDYKPELNVTIGDITAPEIALISSVYPQGLINKTLIEYSATDVNAITYMNLYEEISGEFKLQRTKFCRKETTCQAELLHEPVTTNSTFLVIAVDIYGNKGELKKVIFP